MGRSLSESWEPVERRSRWTEPERLLAVASALLLVANLLLIVALFLNFTGGSDLWNAGKTVWVALGMDLLGAALLGWVFVAIADRGGTRSSKYRRAAGASLLLWVLVTAFWRFALPTLAGSDLQDLFLTLSTARGGVPAWVTRNADYVQQTLGLWIFSAALFLGAHVVILLDHRETARDDWVFGLPVYAWVLASGVSLVATVSIALSLASVLAGGSLAENFNLSLVAKIIVAPNIFISGYASSLQLGREMSRIRSRTSGG